MKINKMKLIKLFFISLIACGCSSSKFVEVQDYPSHAFGYAVGMKTQKKTSCTTAMLELRYGYSPDYMTDENRNYDNKRYDFSLLFMATYYVNRSSYTFISFRQPLNDFVLDESNAFAKMEKTGFLKMGTKITFNKSFEYVIDFESVPNSSGSLQLEFMRSKKNPPLEEYEMCEAIISFTKTDKNIVFKSLY